MPDPSVARMISLIRRTFCSAFIAGPILVACSGSVHDGGQVDVGSRPGPAGVRGWAEGAYVVEANLRPVSPSGRKGPASIQFTLIVDRTLQERLIVGGLGFVQQAPIAPPASDAKGNSPPWFTVVDQGSGYDIHNLVVEPNARSTEAPGLIAGRIEGVTWTRNTDALDDTRFIGSFTARPDDVAPRVAVGSRSWPDAVFDSSEPLPANTSARLWTPTGTMIPLVPRRDAASGLVMGFHSGGRLLPPGSELKLEIFPSFIDVARNEGDVRGLTLNVPEIPLVNETGFEGEPLEPSFPCDDALPAISGERSATWHELSFRMRVEPGDRFLRAQLRYVDGEIGPVRLGAPGEEPLAPPTPVATQRIPWLCRNEAQDRSETLELSEVVEIVWPLPDTVKDEVLVFSPRFRALHPPSPFGQFLIDNLRVEP
jgi:hypothetical protein